METESWNEPWRRNHGEGIMEEESWRGELGSVSMEASRCIWKLSGISRRHQPGTQSHPAGSQEGPKEHPGDTQETPRRHPRLQRPLREKNCNYSPLKYKSAFYASQLHDGFLRVGVFCNLSVTRINARRQP